MSRDSGRSSGLEGRARRASGVSFSCDPPARGTASLWYTLWTPCLRPGLVCRCVLPFLSEPTTEVVRSRSGRTRTTRYDGARVAWNPYPFAPCACPRAARLPSGAQMDGGLGWEVVFQARLLFRCIECPHSHAPAMGVNRPEPPIFPQGSGPVQWRRCPDRQVIFYSCKGPEANGFWRDCSPGRVCRCCWWRRGWLRLRTVTGRTRSWGWSRAPGHRTWTSPAPVAG